MKKRPNYDLVEIICIELHRGRERYKSALQNDETTFSELKKIQRKSKALRIKLRRLFGLPKQSIKS